MCTQNRAAKKYSTKNTAVENLGDTEESPVGLNLASYLRKICVHGIYVFGKFPVFLALQMYISGSVSSGRKR